MPVPGGGLTMADAPVAEAPASRRGRRSSASVEAPLRAAEEEAAAAGNPPVAGTDAAAGPVPAAAAGQPDEAPAEELWPVRDKASWGRPLEEQELSQIDVEAVLTAPAKSKRRGRPARQPKAAATLRVTWGIASGNLYRHFPVVLHVLLVVFVLGACVLFAMSLNTGGTSAPASGQVSAVLQLDRMSEVTPAPSPQTVSPAPSGQGKTAGSPVEIDPMMIGAGIGGLSLSVVAVISLLVIRLVRNRSV
ncbi:MAG TPA: hypothetical protein VF885_25065 [Arthrobacter sp.]